jgi:beta-lactamase class A
MPPPNTPVAHKTGTSDTRYGLTAATNDVGIITLPDGRHITIAVFISDSRADDATRDPAIATSARDIFACWSLPH